MMAIGRLSIATFYMKSRNDGKNGMGAACAAILPIQAPGASSNCSAYSLR
jgi:hypothetical protein